MQVSVAFFNDALLVGALRLFLRFSPLLDVLYRFVPDFVLSIGYYFHLGRIWLIFNHNLEYYIYSTLVVVMVHIQGIIGPHSTYFSPFAFTVYGFYLLCNIFLLYNEGHDVIMYTKLLNLRCTRYLGIMVCWCVRSSYDYIFL